ncbi:MAG: hypothetical protein QOK25_1367 [Thermoleophilaceae bacterium]|nr:hypothetical protein [Thermoleophilaceae bacterium]
MALACALVLVLALAVGAGPAAASSDPANVPWESYLPALPSPNTPQPHSVPFCKHSSVKCVDTELRRLKRAQSGFRCDHRGVFATTYLELTKTLRATLRSDRGFFRFPRYLYTEDALFADVYFNTLARFRRGLAVPPAWQIALDTARSGQVNGGQDMLLGINAHVQNDMPFVVAALGLRSKKGETRKGDHDHVNVILDRAYQRVVDQVARRYDPLVATTNASWNPIDDIGGLEMVKGWREQVWRNAERLVNAKSDSERRQVTADIQQNAANWARLMAAPQTPGYRAQRDAYCAAGPAAG